MRGRAKVLWCEIALVLIGLGTIGLLSRLFAQVGAAMLGVGVVMITAPLVWRFFRFFYRLGANIGMEIRVASTPVPSPAEIAFRLQAEWGRPASLEEVAAVYGMLSNRRNQALINSGIALGSLYLIDHRGH